MVATYSPHSDAGGTLHFPSPTTIRHVDAALAFKQLRRSLSRSPSKGPICRLIPSKSESPSPSSPLSPSRASLQTRAASTGLVPSPNVAQSSPLAPSHSSSVRKTLSSARKLSPMRVALRSRSSQRSPGKPKLSDSSDNGNAMPRSSVPSSDDIENRVGQETGLTEANMECLFKASATEVRENMAPYRALSKFEKSNGSLGTAKSSPLKRSDGIMNLDQKNLGSPSAKRRSIYGSAFGPDFDIFDHEDGLQSHNDARTTKDGLPVEFPGFPEYSNAASPLPRRTSTLRRTTLQQRHDKSTVSRSKLNSDLGLESTIPGQASSKAKLRMSLDGCQPSSINRDSPFSSLGSLPNASVHPIFQPSSKAAATHNQAQPQRHPLSRTITQSSSNSSMADDSPTHIPFRQPDHRKAIVDFSKSLPVGAARPGSSGAASSNLSSQVPSTEASFSTPENYRLAKPLPAAFMSTGLISKRHKDMEDSQPGFQGGRSQMPDTPCKRHSLLGASPIAPDNAIGKTRQARHSFGTPSTPFSPHPARQAPGTFGKGVSIFGSNFNGISMNRRDSFGSIHGDDNTTSPTTKHHSQSSNECDLPPTPTKQALVSSFLSAPGALEQRGVYEDLGITIGVGTRSGRLNQACKSISHLLEKPSGSVDGDSDNTVDKSPSVGLRFRSSFSVPSSFTGSRFMRRFTPPSPLLNISYNHSSTQSTRPETKSSLISPASPVSQRLEPLSPRTPREGMIPPDPSGLSISAHGNGQSFRPLGDSINGRRNPPPATPTASRENFSSFGNGRPSLNSSFNTSFAEIDSSLKSKFDKVELIGEGQFSLVYRVARTQEPKATRGYFTLPPNVESPKTPMPDKVWAVKRSRNPFIGPRDRLRKYQEVRTLRALGQNDHIVQFIDSWEDKNQLYIQTEFCEEGSLDRFLHEAGRRARLDDFRIWKILLELSLGLRHIHDCDFIHLDLKPANVLVTFEGLLKIGDFGMATSWPAPYGTDGEGDREYIGPEILTGQFDKPSDIFALGLILLEIAGNVVLPDNGASWQRLRSGDMSDVPSLTSSSASSICRDSSGKPLSEPVSVEDFYAPGLGSDNFGSPSSLHARSEQQKPSESDEDQFERVGELANPPSFMVDANHPEALDKIVRWMISPKSIDRPTADEILATTSVRWTDLRRRAGATIYEGNWGPADDIFAHDTEIMDV